MANAKKKRKRGASHGNRWTRPAPYIPRPDPVDLAALDAMAAAVAPRVLDLLRDRIDREIREYGDPEIALGVKALAEIGYVVMLPERDARAEDLIRALAEETVRAVKSRFADAFELANPSSPERAPEER